MIILKEFKYIFLWNFGPHRDGIRLTFEKKLIKFWSNNSEFEKIILVSFWGSFEIIFVRF